MRRSRPAALIAIALLGVAAYCGWRGHQLAFGVLPVDAARIVLVEPGSSVRGIARALAEQGVVAEAEDVVWAVRLWGSAPLKAGEYRVEPGGTLIELLRQLERGEVVQHGFTLVEGQTLRELRQALRSVEALAHTLDGVADDDLLAALGAPPGPAEGRFLPETYRFPRGTTDREFLRRALRAMDAALAEAWAARDPAAPLAEPADLLTLASLIERETGVPEERAAIAGVFARRLALGMRLQTDPSVIYGMGDRFDGNLRRQDLMTDTPYNTYTRRGLPPTPICMPSRAALAAAARPAAGDALYFVATGDGGHAFSATYAEHQAALRRYLKRLREQRGAP